ncbi:hypothetical protein H920_08829 [Fukomys damarensis]|uniref:Uncharacterized protein n=1 Tax=Fukomys damarensis TaxID=885580 RepID=A0A091DC30_FUKDA|nr:hypothetical protein H920_08829 [Fukomys damarensis]
MAPHGPCGSPHRVERRPAEQLPQKAQAHKVLKRGLHLAKTPPSLADQPTARVAEVVCGQRTLSSGYILQRSTAGGAM